MAGIAPYKIKKAFMYLKHYGVKGFAARVKERLTPPAVDYGPWYEAHRPTQEELSRLAEETAGGPLVSVVVPAYKTPEKFMKELIESLQNQAYANWELVIADASASEENEEGRSVAAAVSAFAGDARVRYVPLPENASISENTNKAVAAAKGEYIAFCDHDDLLAPQALARAAKAIDEEGADMLYSDEDKVRGESGEHYQPHFKPDFNLDLLRSNNYITHLLIVKRTLAEAAGPFDPSMDGAQDYDFILRCSEKAEKIVHIPEVLYHWRTHEASTADNPMSKQYAYEAGKRAIEAHLARTGTAGEVTLLPDFGFYRVKYPVNEKPLVSIIIPNKDAPAMLEKCIEGIRSQDYGNYEILIVENNSEGREVFSLYKKLSEDERIRLLRYRGSFNYSAINNYAASKARGSYLLFLNNDVRGDITHDWLSEMLGVCLRPEVGAVGARLYYPNDTIQHAGVIIGIGGVAGAVFVDLPKSQSGYMHKAALMQDLSCCTAACLLMKKEAFDEAGGFTEELAVAFNDVDLCLKLRENGRLIVYDPYAELHHDESKTRGSEDTPEKVERFNGEIAYMKERWSGILKEGDPMYNPNLTLTRWDYSLKA